MAYGDVGVVMAYGSNAVQIITVEHLPRQTGQMFL